MKIANEECFMRAARDLSYVNELLMSEDSVEPEIRGLIVRSAQVVRHKAGKRCLIKYSGVDASGEEVAFLGKIRFKGLDQASATLQKALYNAGFDGVDGFAVPRVYGELPSLNMWLQEFVSCGVALSFDADHFVAHHQLVAQALAKLHQTSITLRRQHSVADEVDLLQVHFQQLQHRRPELTTLIESLHSATLKIAQELSLSPIQTTIHRDFYFDQILLSENRTVIVDLDLCCMGPAELDVGNYIGHLREYALRCPQYAKTCQAAEEAFMVSYFDRMPRASRDSAELWATLTLARHVSLSTILPGRAQTTYKLLTQSLSKSRQMLSGNSSW